FRLLVALDVFVHHFGSRTFQELGLNTRQRLEANFAVFHAKWGLEYSAGYHLPPLPAGEERPAVPEEKVGSPPADGEKSGHSADAGPGDPGMRAGAVASVDSGVRVSLCMIVRNEEHHLPDCLRSVRDLVDEIVVVDTGSTDGTRELAQSFGSRVFDF